MREDSFELWIAFILVAVIIAAIVTIVMSKGFGPSDNTVDTCIAYDARGILKARRLYLKEASPELLEELDGRK